MERYRQNNQLTEVPGSLRRKIEIYADLDHHPSQTLETDEQEKFVETASRIKKQVWLQVRNRPLDLAFNKFIYIKLGLFKLCQFIDAATWSQF